MLRHLRNVAFEITPGLVADFVLGPKTCAVFISLRYHLLYPHYLIQRIKVRLRLMYDDRSGYSLVYYNPRRYA